MNDFDIPKRKKQIVDVKRITLIVPDDMFDKLNFIREHQCANISELIRKLIRDFFEENSALFEHRSGGSAIPEDSEADRLLPGSR